jgi:hypothetical protein
VSKELDEIELKTFSWLHKRMGACHIAFSPFPSGIFKIIICAITVSHYLQMQHVYIIYMLSGDVYFTAVDGACL